MIKYKINDVTYEDFKKIRNHIITCNLEFYISSDFVEDKMILVLERFSMDIMRYLREYLGYYINFVEK